ncbi:hypothetical protein FRC12_013765 [Ceratobasidium sp. 428]|nr:hypothetical protein FRC12_013765 [Ceratobasidium sp. 428]
MSTHHSTIASSAYTPGFDCSMSNMGTPTSEDKGSLNSNFRQLSIGHPTTAPHSFSGSTIGVWANDDISPNFIQRRTTEICPSVEPANLDSQMNVFGSISDRAQRRAANRTVQHTFFIQGPSYSNIPTHVLAPTDVATTSNYTTPHTLAVTLPQSLNPIDKLRLARKHNIPEWENLALEELCHRTSPITLEEAKMIGLEKFMQVLRIREERVRVMEDNRDEPRSETGDQVDIVGVLKDIQSRISRVEKSLNEIRGLANELREVGYEVLAVGNDHYDFSMRCHGYGTA